MKALFFTIVFILVLPWGGWAAKPATPLERLRQRSAPNSDCKALEMDLKASLAPSLGTNGAIIRAGKIDWILRRLESLNFVDDDFATLVAAGFAEKPKETYLELKRISSGECIVEVHRMVKTLIATAAEPGQQFGQQKKIIEAIRKWLKGARPPTLARTLVDFEVLKSLSKTGLWNLSREKTSSLEREMNAMSGLSREFNKVYYGEEFPKTVSLDHADFNKLQPTLVREVKEAAALSSWVKSFVAEMP